MVGINTPYSNGGGGKGRGPGHILVSLNIFYCRKGTLQSNNTITQSNRIRTKAGSLYSSSPDHE